MFGPLFGNGAAFDPETSGCRDVSSDSCARDDLQNASAIHSRRNLLTFSLVFSLLVSLLVSLLFCFRDQVILEIFSIFSGDFFATFEEPSNCRFRY